MSDTPEARIHCAYLNGSDGFSCDVVGPYTHDRKKLTQARIAEGPVERLGGKVSIRHLRCIPAEEAHAKQGGPNAIPYQEVVRRQATCTHYQQIDAELMRDLLKRVIHEADIEGERRKITGRKQTPHEIFFRIK